MSQSVPPTLLCLALALLLAITGCASGPAPEPTVQRFDAAMRSGSDKFAAGDLQHAVQAFEQAERVAALHDRRALRLQALLSLGAVAATQAQDAQALLAYQQALGEAQGLADAHASGVALAGVADAQRRLGAHAAAVHSYSLALAPTALREGSTERLQARMGLALLWHAQGQTPAAVDALQVLETQARASASVVLPGVLANQAALLREGGQVQAALAKAQEALALDRRAANPLVLAADLELLGRIHHDAQQPAQARDHWERALRIGQATGQSQAVQRLQRLLDGLSARP